MVEEIKHTFASALLAPELHKGLDDLIEYAVGHLVSSGHLRPVDAIGAKQVLRYRLLNGPLPTAC